MGGQKMYQRMGVHAPFDPQHRLVTSAVFPPIVLALIRSTLALYTLVSIVFSLAWKSVRFPGDPKSGVASCVPVRLCGHNVNPTDALAGRRTFSYFTDLSFIGFCAYFFASAVQTMIYAVGGGKGYPLQKWPRILQFLHLLLISTIFSFRVYRSSPLVLSSSIADVRFPQLSSSQSSTGLC